MDKKIKILILITFSLFSFLIGKRLLSNQQRINKDEILSSKDGKPIFATGNCGSDFDCFPSGCSEHICANHEVITTCENIQFQEKDTYACGCIEQRCVWFR